jgi:hypothetical protein
MHVDSDIVSLSLLVALVTEHKVFSHECTHGRGNSFLLAIDLFLLSNNTNVESVHLSPTGRGDKQHDGVCTTLGLDPTKGNDALVRLSPGLTHNLRLGLHVVSRQKQRARPGPGWIADEWHDCHVHQRHNVDVGQRS